MLGVVGGVLHFALGIGWFSIVSHDIDPAEKADYLSSLLDSPVLKGVSLGAGALFSAIAFGLYSGTSRPYIANLIYAFLRQQVWCPLLSRVATPPLSRLFRSSCYVS